MRLRVGVFSLLLAAVIAATASSATACEVAGCGAATVAVGELPALEATSDSSGESSTPAAAIVASALMVLVGAGVLIARSGFESASDE